METPRSNNIKGRLFVISGPSGVGKGTLVRELCHCFPDIRVSISVTTRLPREGEREGSAYFFRTEEQFRGMIQRSELLEYAQFVNGCFYGTPRAFVEEMLAEGHDVILEIDVKGAMQIKEHWPQGVFVFILPPSLEELENRLRHRKTESEEAIQQRVSIADQEMAYIPQFDYLVTNDDLKTAVDKLAAILVAERCRVKGKKEKTDGSQLITR